MAVNNELGVFLIFKGVNEKYLVRKCSLKYLETINIFSFQKQCQLLKLLFLYSIDFN